MQDYKLSGAHGWTYSICSESSATVWKLEHEETGLTGELGDFMLTVSRPSEGKTILRESVLEMPYITVLTILNNVARDEKDYKTKKQR